MPRLDYVTKLGNNRFYAFRANTSRPLNELLSNPLYLPSLGPDLATYELEPGDVIITISPIDTHMRVVVAANAREIKTQEI